MSGLNSSSTKSLSSSTGLGSNDLSSIFNRAITGKSEWPDKEEFLDVIYWLRQLVGLVLGLIWGTFAVQGILLACNDFNFMLQEDVIIIYLGN